MVKRQSSLVDQHGRPLQYDVLDREIAGPTLAGMRSIITGYPAQGLDPGRLAHILRAADQGDATAYFELAEQIEEKDPHYNGTLGVRKRAVAQLDITVEAAGDEEPFQQHADLLRRWIDRDELEGEIFDIQDALGKSISFTELLWDTKAAQWLPTLKTRDQRFFEFDPNDGETPLLKGGIEGMAGQAQPLPPYKFIIHRAVAKTGLTVRGGLARVVAWPYLFKNFALKDWVIFAEVYGIPMRVGKYDASATEEDRRTLLRAVVGIGTDAAGIIPRSMEIEFVNAMANGNAEVFQNLCDYLDKQVSKAVLGQTGTTDATTGGFGSSGDVHNDVRQDIQRADAKALAATLNRDLVRPIIDFNFGPPPDGRYPRIKIGQAEKLTKEWADIIYDMVDRGAEVEMSVMTDKAGLPDASKKKDVKLIQPRSVAAANSTPPAPEDGSGAPTGAQKPKAASMAALKALNRPLNSDGTLDAAPGDAIDRLVDMTADGWVEVMAPMIGPIEASLSAATSIEDFRDGLISVLEKMDAGKMTELMARAAFNARLAGEAALDVTGDAS